MTDATKQIMDKIQNRYTANDLLNPVAAYIKGLYNITAVPVLNTNMTYKGFTTEGEMVSWMQGQFQSECDNPLLGKLGFGLGFGWAFRTKLCHNFKKLICNEKIYEFRLWTQ